MQQKTRAHAKHADRDTAPEPKPEPEPELTAHRTLHTSQTTSASARGSVGGGTQRWGLRALTEGDPPSRCTVEPPTDDQALGTRNTRSRATGRWQEASQGRRNDRKEGPATKRNEPVKRTQRTLWLDAPSRAEQREARREHESRGRRRRRRTHTRGEHPAASSLQGTPAYSYCCSRPLPCPLLA